MSTEPGSLTSAGDDLAIESSASNALKVIGWFSVGVAVATVGLLVGAELRNRYKFNHRTPYDFYANAGEQQASEFGVGI